MNEVINLSDHKQEHPGDCTGCGHTLTKDFYWMKINGREGYYPFCKYCRDLLKLTPDQRQKLMQELKEPAEEQIKITSMAFEKQRIKVKRKNKKRRDKR